MGHVIRPTSKFREMGYATRGRWGRRPRGPSAPERRRSRLAAGVNAKALSTYMRHSSITITLDRYGHLMPGNEEEAVELLDAYLQRTSRS